MAELSIVYSFSLVDLTLVECNDILFTNRLTAPPSATAPPAILSSRDRSIAGYS